MSAVRKLVVLLSAVCMLGSATLDARVRAHPLYVMLVQYDREIRALRATEDVPELAAAPNELRRDAALASTDAAAAGLGALEGARAAAFARGSSPDAMTAYASQLRREASASLARYSRALDARVARAYAARRQQFAEAEATLAYELERRDAPRVAPLRAKLLTLRLDKGTLARLNARFGAIVRAEDAQVSLLRARDDAELAQYRATLVEDAARDGARAEHDMAARIASNLRERSAVERALKYAPSASPVARSRDNAVEAQTGAALAATFAARGGALATSLRDTNAEIVTLERERKALYDEIVASMR